MTNDEMTNDDLFIIRLNIAHYQAMLELDIDEEKRIIIEKLLTEAEDVLSHNSKFQQ